jgi:F-type H+-transporting ATPase subunit gamma
MSSLREIRKRLNAVKNIQQITTAMEMVASARLRRLQHKIQHMRPYTVSLQEILHKLAVTCSDFSHPLMVARPPHRIGLVVIASDKGLCGSYNKNLFAAADRFLVNHSSESEHVEVIVVGHKAISYYQRKKWHIKNKSSSWSSQGDLEQVHQFTDQLLHWFLSGDLDEIWVAHTEFVTLQKQTPKLEKFLPLEKPSGKAAGITLDYIFEPSPLDIYNDLLPRYCFSKVQMLLVNSYAAELASRVFSMKAAAKNAEDMMENLTLLRNKARQTNITKEILEIVAGTVEN